MSILFQTTGILTTLQDLGRIGFRRFGINPNGVMDAQAARMINILLGNKENSAVLEMHFPAPSLLFETNALIAIGGADFAARLNDQPIENWRLIYAREKSVLSFTRRNLGARIYLGVSNNFAVEKWLESSSTNLKAKAGGFAGRVLQKNDRIYFAANNIIQSTKFNYKISNNLIPRYSSVPKVRVLAGAEWNGLTKQSQNDFLNQSFVVKNESDRMGFRLRGNPIYLKEKVEIVSSAVDFGTIQLLPDGQMIILMADCQTTGGYPRLAHVVSIDLPLLAQLNANETINFEMITIEEAEDLLLKREVELNYLKAACKFRL